MRAKRVDANQSELVRQMRKIPGKYRAVKTIVNGISFHSKKEAKRYGELLLLMKAGEIQNLKLQPVYEIKVNGVKICKYIGDFEYSYKGIAITEDVKGFKTREYVLKKKLMMACFNIQIKEI